jgi:hypothetical protein
VELSIIVPAHNESCNIQVLAERLVPVLERGAASFEIIFVLMRHHAPYKITQELHKRRM